MDTYFRLHRTDCFASIQKVFKGIVSWKKMEFWRFHCSSGDFLIIWWRI
jgi:hypothetical protein